MVHSRQSAGNMSFEKFDAFQKRMQAKQDEALLVFWKEVWREQFHCDIVGPPLCIHNAHHLDVYNYEYWHSSLPKQDAEKIRTRMRAQKPTY